MAKFTRLEVAAKMAETGMVPLFYHSDIKIAKKTIKACYEGGARLLEFTSRGDFAHQIFEQLNQYAIAELPEMIMGVGSVTDAAAASLYMQLGANFIVTPVLRDDIAARCFLRCGVRTPSSLKSSSVNSIISSIGNSERVSE